MSFAGLSRPMRAAAFALLGVAAIATMIGTASVLSGDGPSDSAAPEDTPPTQTTARPGAPGTGESPAPQPTTPTTTESPRLPGTSYPTGAPGPDGDRPSSEAPRPGGSGDGKVADPVRSVPVRVYNNSTVKNLAKRAAEDFRAQGWHVVEVGNYSDGIIPTSTGYFRPGTDEEAAARAIAKAFGMRSEPRFDGIEDSSAGVIVIVTRDYQGRGSGGKG